MSDFSTAMRPVLAAYCASAMTKTAASAEAVYSLPARSAAPKRPRRAAAVTKVESASTAELKRIVSGLRLMRKLA